mgnify:FL=1
MSTIKTAIIITSIISIIGLVVLGTIFIFIEKNVEATQSVQRDIQIRETASTQIQRTKKQLDSIGADKDFLFAHILPDSDIVKIIEAIEAIGKDTNVNVTISNLVADDSTNAPVGTINKVKARVDGRGSWKDVLGLIDRVEALPYKINISNISLKQEGALEKTKAQAWNTSFQIEILKIK